MMKSTLMAPKWMSGHQPPFPDRWDNLPPTVQKTARPQHHLCSWGYSHQCGTELLPTHGPSPSRRSGLLWRNVLFTGNWRWRHREPFYLPIMNLLWLLSDRGIRVRFCWIPSHCAFEGNERLDQLAKETPDQNIDPLTSVHYTDLKPLVNSAVGSNQVGCSNTWPRSLPGETNSGANKEIPALNQSWRGCDRPTSNWPYEGHQVSYLVLRSTGCLSPLWSNINHWPYAPRVCSITGMSWRILHNWLIEYPLWDNSRDLHSGIRTISGILLSDMNGQIFYTVHHLSHPRSDGIC